MEEKKKTLGEIIKDKAAAIKSKVLSFAIDHPAVVIGTGIGIGMVGSRLRIILDRANQSSSENTEDCDASNSEKEISFKEWVKSASDEELIEAYDEDRATVFKNTGVKTWKMEIIDNELYDRGVKKWRREHPNEADIGTPWKDKERYER